MIEKLYVKDLFGLRTEACYDFKLTAVTNATY